MPNSMWEACNMSDERLDPNMSKQLIYTAGKKRVVPQRKYAAEKG